MDRPTNTVGKARHRAHETWQGRTEQELAALQSQEEGRVALNSDGLWRANTLESVGPATRRMLKTT